MSQSLWNLKVRLHEVFPPRVDGTCPQPALEGPPSLHRALSSRGLLIINWRIVQGLTVLLTDHLTMNEPGKRKDATRQLDHPEIVSCLEQEVAREPQPVYVPLRTPLLNRAQAERDSLGPLLTELGVAHGLSAPNLR